MNKILNLLEGRLHSMVGNIATAWPNAIYDPVVGTPYQRVDHLVNKPRDWTLERDLAEQRGIMQVTLHYPVDSGRFTALDQAAKIAAEFAPVLMLESDNGRLYVNDMPQITGGYREDNWWCVVVSISWSFMQ